MSPEPECLTETVRISTVLPPAVTIIMAEEAMIITVVEDTAAIRIGDTVADNQEVAVKSGVGEDLVEWLPTKQDSNKVPGSFFDSKRTSFCKLSSYFCQSLFISSTFQCN